MTTYLQLGKRILCMALLLGFSTCKAAEATAVTTEPVYADAPAIPQVVTKDPLEGFNRAMFTFNDKLDIWILKPVATLYNKIMPKPLNQGVSNFFKNVNNIPTIVNDLLQFNFYQSANDLWRLGVNTTVGVGGLFDVAARMNLRPYSNDFGLTMAYWGYENSNYLVLPFFGPSTIRDGIGLPVDFFAFSVYPYLEPPSLRFQLYGLGVIDRRASLLQFQPVMEEASLDKYVFVRNAYLQHRSYQMNQNLHRGYADQLAQSSEPAAAHVPVPVLSANDDTPTDSDAPAPTLPDSSVAESAH